MAYNILLVEDSKQICENIVDFFKIKGGDDYHITVVNDGLSAIRDEGAYDMVFLDIMLPHASGFDVCVAIRKRSDCPIIFMTALGTEENILKGYDLGADDYIVKPFSLDQLFAKTNAMIKRNRRIQKTVQTLSIEEIELDPVAMRVTVSGNEIETTAREYFLLKALLDNKGCVMTRDQLLYRVWGNDYDGLDRVVDTNIKKLRKVLGPAGRHIKTVIGRGYKIG